MGKCSPLDSCPVDVGQTAKPRKIACILSSLSTNSLSQISTTIYCANELWLKRGTSFFFFWISNNSLNKNHPCTQSVYSRYQLHGELTEVDQLIQGTEMGNV